VNARLARRLAALYPSAWRQRYGDEFCKLLEDEPVSTRAIVNVIAAAVAEHIRWTFDNGDACQRSLQFLSGAALAAFAAGVNFYWTVVDTPLAPAMSAHAALRACWLLVQAGAFVFGLAIVATAASTVPATLRDVVKARRWGLVAGLVPMMLVPLATITWMTIASWPSGSNAATWPTIPAHWWLVSTIVLLLIVDLFACAAMMRDLTGGRQATTRRAGWLKANAVALTCAAGMMAAGAVGWGLFAEQYAAANVHGVAFLGSAALALVAARPRRSTTTTDEDGRLSTRTID